VRNEYCKQILYPERLPTGLEIKVQPKACKGGLLSTLIVSYIVQLLQAVGFRETKREKWKDTNCI